MQDLRRIRHLLSGLPRGARVFVAGCGAEPTLLARAIAEEPAVADGLVFIGVHIPGINRTDYAGLAPGARAEAFFLTPETRQSFAAGRLAFRPMHYSAIYPFLAGEVGCAIAFTKVAPPGPDGTMSMSIAADFLPAMVEARVPVVAEIDPSMPRLAGAPTLAPSACAVVLEGPAAPVRYAPDPPDGAVAAIGRHVAGLVEDGDTVQLGLGKVASGVLAALTGHRRLAFHGGLVTPALAPLVAAGVFTGPVVTGTALGEEAFYDALPDWPRLTVAPASFTHAPFTFAGIPRLKTINSVLAVDLFGQANGETVNGRQISGQGGMGDFVRGARLSRGGRAILALPATAGPERTSRIVPALPAGTVAAVPRGDADLIVTEHGVADVRHLDVDRRAAAIIAIADPAARDGLADCWDALRRAM